MQSTSGNRWATYAEPRGARKPVVLAGARSFLKTFAEAALLSALAAGYFGLPACVEGGVTTAGSSGPEALVPTLAVLAAISVKWALVVGAIGGGHALLRGWFAIHLARRERSLNTAAHCGFRPRAAFPAAQNLSVAEAGRFET
jgi:hypothetical protein